MSKENGKENGKGKGLGWVPEYPDLRDYSIRDEEKLRFKAEENTATVENALKKLIEYIGKLEKTLEKDSNNPNTSGLKNIDKLRNTLLGNIRFHRVKIHKFIRLEDNDKDKEKLIKIEDKLYKQQILALKKCLVILFIKKYLSVQNKGNSELDLKDLDIDLDIEDPRKIIEFINDDNYDKDTEKLVKRFQICSDIKDDGIFGLETYTTLNEYLDDNKYEDKFKSCSTKCTKSTKEYLSKIEFISFTSLIPETAFQQIFKLLRKKADEQIYKQSKGDTHSISLLEKILFGKEYSFLNEYGEIKEKLREHCEVVLNRRKENCSDCHNKGIDVFFESYLGESNLEKYYSSIIEFLRHSYLLEPIVSVTINQMSPLAKWQNKTLDQLIKEGFEKFDDILIKEDKCSQNKINKQSVYSFKEMAEDVIIKINYFLKMEMYLLKEDINKENKDKNKNKYTDYESVILFCLILIKYLNRFPKSHKTKKTNIFDKQEVFEIGSLDSYIDNNLPGKENKEQEKSGIWPTLEVSIPVVNSDIIQEITTKTQDKKLYSLLPGVVDLSFWCSPVRDQGSLNSCTAFAAISLFEYFVNKNFNQDVDASPLFLYKAARNKMNITEDVGASIRETMKALALYGVPPENSWSYDEKKVNEEPPAYCYAYAQNYQSLKYFLLDYPGIAKEALLFQIKAVLAAGFPCIFGFTLYNSAYEDSNEPGHIPFPNAERDKVVGGHTVVAVGYNDFKFIQSADRKQYSKGAFLIRNSWGADWGDKGYGWLPYDYVLAGLTAAWWSLIKSEWFNEGNFGASGGGGETGCAAGQPPCG